MFRINIIVVGHQKAGPHQDLAADYLKRLKTDAVIKLTEIPENTFRSPNDRTRVLAAEAEKIRKAIPKESFLIALDAAGKNFTSEAFAAKLDRWAEGGAQPLTIIIGGPLGLAEEIKKEASLLLSLSPMTMPHDLARVVLLEQLYRAMTILKNKTYHY